MFACGAVPCCVVTQLVPLPFFQLYSPFNNPTETYRYYSLPFCRSHSDEADDDAVIASGARQREKRQGAIRHKQRLGESIVGDRRESSPYDISFLDSIDWRMLCKVEMAPKQLKQFKNAIHNNYFFEMFVEDLPMWGYLGDFSNEDPIIGEVKGSNTFLFPHLHFNFGYNKDQIVSAKVTTDVRTAYENLLKSEPWTRNPYLTNNLRFVFTSSRQCFSVGPSRRYYEYGRRTNNSVQLFRGMES